MIYDFALFMSRDWPTIAAIGGLIAFNYLAIGFFGKLLENSILGIISLTLLSLATAAASFMWMTSGLIDSEPTAFGTFAPVAIAVVSILLSWSAMERACSRKPTQPTKQKPPSNTITAGGWTMRILDKDEEMKE